MKILNMKDVMKHANFKKMEGGNWRGVGYIVRLTKISSQGLKCENLFFFTIREPACILCRRSVSIY